VMRWRPARRLRADAPQARFKPRGRPTPHCKLNSDRTVPDADGTASSNPARSSGESATNRPDGRSAGALRDGEHQATVRRGGVGQIRHGQPRCWSRARR
jgi:hypothetical protein